LPLLQKHLQKISSISSGWNCFPSAICWSIQLWLGVGQEFSVRNRFLRSHKSSDQKREIKRVLE